MKYREIKDEIFAYSFLTPFGDYPLIYQELKQIYDVVAGIDNIFKVKFHCKNGRTGLVVYENSDIEVVHDIPTLFENLDINKFEFYYD